MTSDVLQLTCDLIARASVTPADAGCQALIADRLSAAGFACEHLRLGAVDNLWATHGSGAPVLVLLGHTDVVPPGRRAIGPATHSRRRCAMACCTVAVRPT